ncbi:MAG: AMP-binding protein, partial [Gammaproteobacteria bacterium]
MAGIYWTLTTGGKLVISQARQEQDVDDLLRTISKEHVTHTLCLPSLHHSLLEHADAAGSQQSLDSMQVVINAGEAMPSGEYLELHRSVMPGARIINEYGPTESTVWCSAYDATHHDSRLPVPIGKPIANTRLFILDQNNDLAPIGVSGELVVAGNNLSGGYWKDDEATQRAFRRHNVIDESRTTVYHTGDLARYTEDGNIIYLGRSDQQIKIRGHRIEPQEIESRILSFPDVIAASVIVLHADKRAPQLIACVVVEHDFFELSKLKDHIASQFPDYMVPASFIVLDALPFLANGKLDR